MGPIQYCKNFMAGVRHAQFISAAEATETAGRRAGLEVRILVVPCSTTKTAQIVAPKGGSARTQRVRTQKARKRAAATRP